MLLSKFLFMKFIFTTLLSFLILSCASAQYTSPGVGNTYTLADLAAISGGAVVSSGGIFSVNNDVTISLGDKLEILNDATVKFAPNTTLNIYGNVNINPPTKVLFTAQNIFSSYNGVRMDGSMDATIKKLTFEYAVSFKVFNCAPSFDACTFQYNNNNVSTSFGNGALSLFHGNPIITNSIFSNNQRAAIQGGANIPNAPTVINCYFAGNNTTNQNVPQINIGASGTDTVKIINCEFYAASIKSGAIGFLPLGNLNTIIKGNLIKNNRYGITISGGNNINAVISYNRILNNNVEGNSNTGGSGISLGGGSTTSHQNTIVTGNLLKGNLWGVTVLNFAKPNFGNLSNADTTDDGKNAFINNINASESQSDFYNNTPDDIMAQGNYWNDTLQANIETHIFHKTDNAALGLVDYGSFKNPVTGLLLTAAAQETNALLKWQTSTEFYSSSFTIEKSLDNQNFSAIATVAAAGFSSATATYTFTDVNAGTAGTRVYYRIKANDAFSHFKYSNVAFADLFKIPVYTNVKVYPNPLTQGQKLYMQVPPAHDAEMSVSFFANDGKLLGQRKIALASGSVLAVINEGIYLPAGLVFLKIKGIENENTISIMVK
jgi:hypothetical protein